MSNEIQKVDIVEKRPALPALPPLRLAGMGEDIARMGQTASSLRELIGRVHEEHAGLKEDLETVEQKLREHREDLRFQLGGDNT